MAKQKAIHSLWYWRKKKGLTETELGNAVGVHLNSVRRWEKNPQIIPLAKANAMATVLGISVEQIEFEHDYRELGEDM